MGLHDKSLIEPVERIIVSINLTDVLGGSYNPLFVDKCVFGDPSGMLKQVQHDEMRGCRNSLGLSSRTCFGIWAYEKTWSVAAGRGFVRVKRNWLIVERFSVIRGEAVGA